MLAVMADTMFAVKKFNLEKWIGQEHQGCRHLSEEVHALREVE